MNEGVGVGKVGSWRGIDGGEFILEAQTQKGMLDPHGLSRMGFSKRTY